MKELQLVSFEQAQRLKAAGFSWDCETFYQDGSIDNCHNMINYNTNEGYDEDRKEDYSYFGEDDGVCSAPTTALALKWMRDVHYLFGEVKIGNEPRGLFFFEVFSKYGEFLCGSYLEGDDFSGHYDTYEEAESALLDELLNVLKTKKLNK